MKTRHFGWAIIAAGVPLIIPGYAWVLGASWHWITTDRLIVGFLGAILFTMVGAMLVEMN